MPKCFRVGALVQWLKLPAWKVGDRGFEPHSSHHPQEVILVQFSLYVQKGEINPHSFYFIYQSASHPKLKVTIIRNINMLIFVNLTCFVQGVGTYPACLNKNNYKVNFYETIIK